MTDWCSKISLFSWLSGESTTQRENKDQPSTRVFSHSKQKDPPTADSNRRYSNETTERSRPPPPTRDEQSQSFNKNFSKNDKTIYFHKASGTNFDAKIVGVHFDDDPENPYYTIQYTSSDGERVERQTTDDRLLPVDGK